MKKGFFAYSTKPYNCGQSIESAIKSINESQNYYIKSWKAMSINGRVIINEILDEIDKADFFCADLTGLNDNVLFELGYAISKEKPLFIIFDNSITESKRRYNELSILNSIGYQSYTNGENIITGFYNFASTIDTFDSSKSIVKLYSKNIDKKVLLFLKSRYTTESSKQILSLIREYKIPVTVDDATENKIQQISWYVENLSCAHAIICEFLPTIREEHELQNSKSAFIAGISYGLDLEILILCEEPYDTPMDYKELLKKYDSPQKCKDITLPFIKSINERLIDILTTKNTLIQKQKKRSVLQNINFGDFIAENERELLSDYFVETSLLTEISRHEVNIIVGRKGAGKSATLLYLNETLNNDKRNIVCLIKPENFEIDGLVSLIEDINDEFEKNFLVEAVWKYLVITEIAKTFYEKIKDKASYRITDFDNRFIEFIEKDKSLYLDDISTRLENRIDQIRKKSGESLKLNEFKNKITQSLHLETIHNLKQHFADIIEKDRKIILLIDNLDKSWRKDNKIEVVSKIIFGLISSASKIVNDISVIKNKQKTIDFELTIFLRSDIYKNIIQYANEPDKITPIWLKWDDFEVFFRIIEERFSILNNKPPEELWNKYAIKEIDEERLQNFISYRILPRPRDIIYFFKKALEIAILRGHELICEDDFQKAYSDYSAWVFSSLIVENGITIKQMEEFMYGLMDLPMIISIEQLKQNLIDSKIEAKESDYLEYFIDHLVSLSIIAREIRLDEFEFEYEFNNEKKNKILSKRLEHRRFKIHPALYPYLDIKI